MTLIAFESWSRPLLLLHVIAAVVFLGAVTHGSVFYILSKKTKGNFTRAERFWQIIYYSLPLTLLTGSLAYPTYRIRTRADFLDANFPLVAGLFDVKENYAALVLVLLIACALLRKEDRDSQARQLLHNGFFHGATALAWVCVILGLWVTIHRGIG